LTLWNALKSALSWPQWGGQGVQQGGLTDWITYHGGTGYNYAEAAGELYRNGVVMACAAYIMRCFPEPALQVVKEDESGEENAVARHPLTLAFRKPNPFYGSDVLWQRIIFDRSLYGQAFLYKERNASGKVIALYHIPQHRLIPQWPPTGKTFIDHYLFRVDARQESIPVEDLVHFRFGGDPQAERGGIATLGAGLREIGTLNEGANYRGSILRNMGVPSHILQNKDPSKPINADQAGKLMALWIERVSGPSRGRPLIPNWALEAVKVGMSPAELDLGTMNFEATDLVCSLFGLSAMVVGLSSGSQHKTYSNYAECRQAAVETCLVPAWKQTAQELTLQLLPDYSEDESECVEFDLANVRALEEDQDALWARVDKAVSSGWVQVNEARALVDLPPVEGGDVFLPLRGEVPIDLSLPPPPPGMGGLPPEGQKPAAPQPAGAPMNGGVSRGAPQGGAR